ncbi:LytR/AlgR family response regulator transcription factor [Chitinophaga barathri]|uniref:DNA-binding response regulator n=1 Tax=Chitinophaga barathri TaxID=1647451 RepID=A0A3N4M4V9_9BACT|nr:LytTR family DNA-binding domain-containing protein [Chitinophaga barathri]RPD38172.1 DNA-binding response regulator [Chitinophaga barathri]
MNLRCLVVDDEPLARKGLKEYIADVSFLDLAGECDSAIKAVDFLHKEQVDILFLDIQMPRMTGLELLRTLPQHPLVILTTAYADYAVESFELDVFDYLLKPVSFERFLKAVNKAKTLLKKETAEYFFIKCDNKLEKIALAEVLYTEALQNYVAIHTPTRKYITYLTFNGVEEYLPGERFLKVHKSFIVALDKIESIEGNELIIGGHHIPISRNLKDEVMEKILHNRFLKR